MGGSRGGGARDVTPSRAPAGAQAGAELCGPPAPVRDRTGQRPGTCRRGQSTCGQVQTQGPSRGEEGAGLGWRGGGLDRLTFDIPSSAQAVHLTG